MARPVISTKRLAINKANGQIVAVAAVAAFITIFCLVASKAVFDQNRYLSKVSGQKEKALSQLKSNLEATDTLIKSYQVFDGAPTNVIGGSRTGKADNDGSNSKIILDSLPSTYDFPALTSSIEKILTDRGLKVSSITGTDDQLAQQSNLESPTPKPTEIPFAFSVSNANYQDIQRVMQALQQSIRPIQIDKVELSGELTSMSATVNAHTYYQPAKNVNVTKKVVK